MNCGKSYDKSAKFCPGCNAPVEENGNQRKQQYAGEIRKCPKCGCELPSFTAICPSCGFELYNTRVSNAVQKLANDIAKISHSREALEDESSISIIDKTIANIIRNFPIPNNREDIIEFMILASSNIDENIFYDSSQKEITTAWIAKFEQAYQKAQFTLKDNPDFQQIKSIYDKKKKEIRKSKAKFARRKTAYVLGRIFYKREVWLVLLAVAVVFCIMIFYSEGFVTELTKGMVDDRIKVPISSSEIKQQNYKLIVNQFEDAGFTNVQIERIEDLVTGWLTKDGQIAQVTINGDAEFTKGQRFEKNVIIKVVFHTFPGKDDSDSG